MTVGKLYISLIGFIYIGMYWTLSSVEVYAIVSNKWRRCLNSTYSDYIDFIMFANQQQRKKDLTIVLSLFRHPHLVPRFT